MNEWKPIDENTPRKKTILFWGETSELGDGIMNWRMDTGYIYSYGHGDEDWYWAGQRLNKWDHKPTHWMPLPSPPDHDQKVKT